MNSGLRDGSRHSKFLEMEGCGAHGPWLCENASRILQISALKDAGTYS